MMKIVIVLSIVAIANAGNPFSYSAYTPASSYTFSSGAAIAAAPAYASYAAPALRSIAAPAYASYAAPALRSIAAPAYASYAAPALRSIAAPAYASYAAPALRSIAAPAYASYAAPALVKTVAPEPYDPHPQYNFGYSVQDGLTGDQHSHTESRDGDAVSGQYSLVEPDGALRTVTYTADALNGFNAVVDRQAPQIAVKQVLAAAPVAVGYKALAHGPAYGRYL